MRSQVCHVWNFEGEGKMYVETLPLSFAKGQHRKFRPACARWSNPPHHSTTATSEVETVKKQQQSIPFFLFSLYTAVDQYLAGEGEQIRRLHNVRWR